MRLFLHRCVGATTSPPLSVASVLALGRESPSSASKLFGRTQMASSSLVAGAGQRFESARRLSIFPANTIKVKSLRHEHRGLRQQYVSSRVYPKASSMPSAACLFILLYGASRREGLRRCSDDPRCQVYGGRHPPTPFLSFTLPAVGTRRWRLRPQKVTSVRAPTRHYVR